MAEEKIKLDDEKKLRVFFRIMTNIDKKREANIRDLESFAKKYQL